MRIVGLLRSNPANIHQASLVIEAAGLVLRASSDEAFTDSADIQSGSDGALSLEGGMLDLIVNIQWHFADVGLGTVEVRGIITSITAVLVSPNRWLIMS